MEPIAHLDKNTFDVLTTLIDDVSLLCKDNVIAIYLYGGAAGKGYDPGRSNLNTVIVLKKIEFNALTGIARIKRGPR